jgi:RIP metalloprotease RseP
MRLRIYRGYNQQHVLIDYFSDEINHQNYSPFGYFYNDENEITHVVPYGIAWESGLMDGDVVLEEESTAVAGSAETESPYGTQPVFIRYERDGRTRQARLDPDPSYARIQVLMDDAAMPILTGLPYDHRLATAGMQSGDQIMSIEGVPTPNGITAFLEFERQAGNTVTVMALSHSEERAFVVPIPSHNDLDELRSFFNGLRFKTRYFPADLKSSFIAGVGKTVDIGKFIFMTIGMLVTGEASIKELSGPVGIATITYEAASSGLVDLINIMVLLSVNLAIFNLLPFPALDGGRIIFMIAEAIFRRPVVTVRIENFIHIAGFLLLILFAMFITYQDVVRLIFGN